MTPRWADIAFLPDEVVVAKAAAAWKWLIPENWTCLVCSMFGGIFLEKDTGGVFWLECGTGLVKRVADNAAEFDAFMKAARDDAWLAQIEEWFLTDFVQRLREAGKIPGPGECFGLTILPVFQEGRYEIDNVFVLPISEWLTATASLHQQLRDVKDGEKVQIRIVE